MIFIRSRFADRPLHMPDECMQTFMRVADELSMGDMRGAYICAAMCAFQEAGLIRTARACGKCGPRGMCDPCFAADPGRFPHDSNTGHTATRRRGYRSELHGGPKHVAINSLWRTSTFAASRRKFSRRQRARMT
jgi:hypothetical protein